MVKNLEAAKELVELYRNITIERLEKVYQELCDKEEIHYEDVLHSITGFGSISSCHLCKPIGGYCPNCIHGQWEDCTANCPCIDNETYENIADAESIEDLYHAIQDRADYLENLIKQIENDN